MREKKAATTACLRDALEALGLGLETVRELAKATGLLVRNAGKIDPLPLACVLLREAVNGRPSCNDLAAGLAADSGTAVSRQAVWKRLKTHGQEFFEGLLALVMTAKSVKGAQALPEVARGFARIVIQDSTVVPLPGRLFHRFSGVSNGGATVCNARIQAVFSLLAGEFVRFEIGPYSKNDLKAAPELPLRPGDLTLRDRGYLTCEEVQRHRENGADCIYRHRHGTVYRDPHTDQPIDLAARLERDGCLDLDVCLNNQARTPVRLLAAPVAEETANRRRADLKKNAHAHRCPSAEQLAAMSWTIFITTIARTRADFARVLALYALRWRIETIFKAWKSNLCFDRLHNVSETQLRIILTARLIMAVILDNAIYWPAHRRIGATHNRHLSMLKVIRYMVKNLHLLPAMLAALATDGAAQALDSLAKYCCYDKRKRPSFSQKMQLAVSQWSLG